MTDSPSADRPWLSSYGEGVPLDLPPVTGSLMDLLDESARDYPDAPALQFFGRETTYRALDDAVSRAAAGLRDLGVKKGDRVAIVLPNCPQHIIAFYAVLRLGAVVVEHNPLYTPRELRTQFQDHGARHAIVWSKVAGTVQEFPADLRVEAIISVDITTALPLRTRLALRLPVKKARESRDALTSPVKGALSWDDLVRTAPLPASHPRPGTGDLAVLQYTSGTTGTPKGAMLTHRNLLANARQSQAFIPAVTRGDGCVFYAVLPMFHAYGLTLCLTFAMSMGARLVLFPKFDADMVIDAIKKHPPTVLPLVPPIAERLLARARERGASIRGIRIGVSGAMALSAALVEPFEEASGGYLIEGYGLSECSPVLMVNPPADNRKAGTIGIPIPGTDARVVDPEDPSRILGAGEPGELVVRGPQVFSGYYGKPEETEKVLIDGWFRTGDIVERDDDGFFRVVDRLKELIVTGGFNVSPSEVEATLRQHPQVADAAVVGLPDPHSGEQVVAAIIPAPGVDALDVDDIRAFARTRLTPYKVPRRVEVVDELPRSLIGKVLRRQVRDTLLAEDA
ncbi:AMP-binding protein [Microbacterium sp. EYE_5]|uniref:long-chain-fatty-acid--CoA ligase n=1 Tax=unclassified Microbacterium TaxID=2609290 RepID=UPI002006B38C|nr:MULTISPECIES: long-chain-fatty-acid--CoA ligase [unclassified Microbacterium]MCK6080834.1 AMP-binding protein [Microbacterium sp. EYE_382]MCK6086105.1 AMP-binding protein [Microbacterium sp. EYE_384]MCK6124397.1 AMP-binding protein [Microbacterium sp. EYE_80]MCK6127306.1 AMP-binding protein [Microbacterium sp. EYE_79]MCK6141789.1 AMP-binding protein [Microbacterium sp. EYE_39]